jgi:type II secretory pathway pseudopilin PulG
MKRSIETRASFSLVEVVLALGVAAFCLLAVVGLLPTAIKVQQASVQQTAANSITSGIIADLRAAFRRPGLGNSSQFGIELKKLPPGLAAKYTPAAVYFSLDGTQQNGAGGAIFKATITYYSTAADNSATSTFADIIVSWPASQDDLTKAAGYTETLAVIDRPVP